MVTPNTPSSLIASYSQVPLSGQNNSDARSPVVLNSSIKPVTELEKPVATVVRTGAQSGQPEPVDFELPGRQAQESEDSEGSGQQASRSEQAAEADAKIAEQREKQQLLEDQRLIFELSARDREVRAHEQAHAAIGGQYAGAPQYDFQRGPDGVNYAVGGEVKIDVSREPTPQETIAKMQIVRRAALAPAEPSPQDRRVAAQASQTETEARAELNAQRVEEASREREQDDDSSAVENPTVETAPTGLSDQAIAAENVNNPGVSQVSSARPVIRSSEASSFQLSSAVSLPIASSQQILSYSSDVQRNAPGALLDQLV